MPKYAITILLFFFILFSFILVAFSPYKPRQVQALYPCEGVCLGGGCSSPVYEPASGECAYGLACCQKAPGFYCEDVGGSCVTASCSVYGALGSSAYCGLDKTYHCCIPDIEYCSGGVCRAAGTCQTGYVANGSCTSSANAGKDCCVLNPYCPGGSCKPSCDKTTEVDQGDNCPTAGDRCCAILANQLITCSTGIGCGPNLTCGTDTCGVNEVCMAHKNCVEDPTHPNNCGYADCSYPISGYGCAFDPGHCWDCHPSRCVADICDYRTAGCSATASNDYHAGCGSIDDCYQPGVHGASCSSCNPTGGGGTTPTPTPANGTARVRAHVILSSVTACADVGASTNYLAESIAVTPDGTPTGAQAISGGVYATWTVAGNTTYTVQDTAPSGYVLKMACYNGGTGMSAYIAGSTTVTWELGYSLGSPWAQTQGGDVYAQTNIRSYIPPAAVPRYFSLDGAGVSPGIIQYGTAYDFDSTALLGEQYVSSKGWLASDTNLQTDYYAVMYKRFGSPTDADYSGGTTLNTQLAGREKPYYVTGDLTVDGVDWSVTTGQSVIVIVDGNLIINKNINITGTGFVAFIVKGDITVGPAVGVPWSSSSPVLEGIYITSLDGTFHTGNSSVLGSQRFVGSGTFIAGTFDLKRDLGAVAHNVDTSADLFIYNPKLLLTMPDAMRDVPITWQEVAP